MSPIKLATRSTGLAALEAALHRSGATNIRRTTHGRATHIVATAANGQTRVYAALTSSRPGLGFQTMRIDRVAASIKDHAAAIGAQPYIALVHLDVPTDVRRADPDDVVAAHRAVETTRAAQGATGTLVGTMLLAYPGRV